MRYKVIEGSESGHCCFKATVVDTQRPDSDYDPKQHSQICECFDMEDAEKIASALNGGEC